VASVIQRSTGSAELDLDGPKGNLSVPGGTPSGVDYFACSIVREPGAIVAANLEPGGLSRTVSGEMAVIACIRK
jgi:hypothetical protein